MRRAAKARRDHEPIPEIVDDINQKKIIWLKRYRANQLEIERLLDEMARWNSFATRTTTVISGMPLGGATSDKVGTAIAEIDSLQREFAQRLNDRIQLQRQIEDAIAAVDEPRLQMLLRYRYLDGMTWEHIAVKLNYSYRQVLRHHMRSIEALTIKSGT